MPDTRDWVVSGDPIVVDLKKQVTKLQQRKKQRLLNPTLIQKVRKSQIKPRAFIQPLSRQEVVMMVDNPMNSIDLGEKASIIEQLLSIKTIPEGDQRKDQSFFVSYAQRIRDVEKRYRRELKENLQGIKDDVKDAAAEGEAFTFNEQKEMRVFLDKLAKKNYERGLLIAESYRNDLANWLQAKLTSYIKYGDHIVN